ncbi:MAG: Ig-like domain-containing protein, partial [Gemmatimonadales bacterium]
MTSSRRHFAILIAFGLSASVAACGGDGLVLPNESRPAKIAIVAGDAQSAAVGAPLSQPIVVKVTDALDRPVEGQAVAFTIDAGGGQVAPASVETGSDGEASAAWTLGSAAGQQRVQARIAGTDLLLKFTASALSGAGSRIQLVSGDHQTAAVGSALADSLVVRVTDDLGNPVGGVEVLWSATGGGTISPTNVVSATDGTAAAERVLGGASGTQGAEASANGITPVAFTHTAEPANPTALVLVSGNGQTGGVSAPLPDPLVVRLVDDNGNGVGGKAITWVVGSGGGSPSPTTVSTNPNGFAETQWTLGPNAGSTNNLINAVFPGVPSVPFTALAEAGVATKLTFTQPPVTTSAGNPITPAVRVDIQDASGNTVTSATGQVTLAIGANPGAGILSGTTTVDAVNGVATFSNLSIDKTGTGYTLVASGIGLPSVTSPAFDILTGSANRLVFLTGPTDRVVGEKFSPGIQVQVQDAGGNPVTFGGLITLTSSVTGTLSGTATATAVLGTATFSNLAINKAGATYMLTAFTSGATSATSATSAAFDVAKASTTIAITGKSPGGASVTGQAVTFNYDVNVVAPGVSAITGTVTVSDGTQSCTGAINAGSGVGSCAIAFASAGDRSVTATYSGDLNLEPSPASAPPTTHTVNKAGTTLNVNNDTPDPSVVGQTVTVNWTLAAAGAGAGTPTGTVSVSASGSAGCSAPAAFGAGSCNLVFTTSTTNGNGISAAYTGDANFNGSVDSDG